MTQKTSKSRKAPTKTPAKPAAKASPTGPGAGKIALGVTAGLGAIAAIMVGVLGFGRRRTALGAEHAAPDLAADAAPVGSQRAPDAFRPDPTAPIPASEREALRPATGPGPSMVAMRGEMANQTGASNG